MRRLFIVFALGCMCCAGYAQNVLTIGEVFDFEPGDEFHLKNEIQQVIAQGQRITITDKWFSANADTVFYVQENDRYLIAPQGMFMPWSYSFTLHTDTLFYTHLDSLITTYDDWISADSGMVANGWYHSWFQIDSLLCNIEINGYSSGPIPLDFPGYGATFGRGVGQTYEYYIDEMDIVTSNWRMKYYKKGPFTCGTPDLTTAVLTELQKNTGSVTPNPFSDQLTFHFTDNEKHHVFITDLNGRVLIAAKVSDGQCFSAAHLPGGVYLVQSETGDMLSRICK